MIPQGAVIATATGYSGAMSYTATQDCYIYCYFEAHSTASVHVSLDGVNVFDFKGNNYGSDATCILPVKSGQVMQMSKSSYHAGYDMIYVVYDLNN